MMAQHYSIRKMLALVGLGAGLEFFDFTAYALFAHYLASNFFANSDNLVALLNTFSVFALGYLARPLGGLVLGHIGDKQGRKKAFTYSILYMAVATLGIGCLPNYQHIGIAAPILLIFLRLAQGFFMGGELPGAATFILEHFRGHKTGFAVSLIFMCTNLGCAFASLLGVLLAHFLSMTDMLAWGWRIPFLFGFVLGLVGYFVRKHTVETPEFLDIVATKQTLKLPLRELMKNSRRGLIVGCGIAALIASVSSFQFYLPTYFSSILHYSTQESYSAALLSFVLLALLTPLMGLCSDYLGRRFMLMLSAVLIGSLGYYLFVAVVQHSLYMPWLFALGLITIAAPAGGCYVISIAEQFPAIYRYSGIGFSFNFALAIFAGLAPVVITYLIKVTHNPISPYYYLVTCSFITLIAALLWRGLPHRKFDTSVYGDEAIR